jgi:hypothetical protein
MFRFFHVENSAQPEVLHHSSKFSSSWCWSLAVRVLGAVAVRGVQAALQPGGFAARLLPLRARTQRACEDFSCIFPPAVAAILLCRRNYVISICSRVSRNVVALNPCSHFVRTRLARRITGSAQRGLF